MKWTKEAPIKEGWYWLNGYASDKTECVEVFMYRRYSDRNDPSDCMCVRRVSDEGEVSLDYFVNSLWMGPLEVPQATKAVIL